MFKKGLTTAEIADLFSCKENTPRSNLCTRGHYLGMVPTRLPNGRLLWSGEQAERVSAGLPARPGAEEMPQPGAPSWREKLRAGAAAGGAQ